MVDSSRICKRKRSLQDSPIDLTKIRMAMNGLSALKEELESIEEIEGELTAVMHHVGALEAILKTAKKPKLSFSSVSDGDLKKIGLIQKRLVFSQKGIEHLISAMSENAIEESQALYARIQEIYEFVNMDFEAGSRMLLEAVLLHLGKTIKKSDKDHSVAILPEMRLGTEDGVKIMNPLTHYEVWLTGSVDYAILKYVDEPGNRGRLLDYDASRKFVLETARGCLFLVKAKCLEAPLSSFLPEAITQAIALSKLSGQTRVHFCLSNGQSWIFCLLNKDANSEQWTTYESLPRRMTRDSAESVREIFQLVLEWLAPTGLPGLYALVTN